jgi:trehalose 6-phosphate phosphatase
MSPDGVTVHKDRWSLFLDVDGILLDAAETPQRGHVSERIKELLVALTVQLDGAVALLSGRSLDDIDRLFSPLRFCAAGVRGCEYRESSGCVTRTPMHVEQLVRTRDRLHALVQRHDGLRLEDKRYGLAVHFQRASHLKEEVHRAVKVACSGAESQFAVEAGCSTVEIWPSGCTTATAMSLFMQQTPFAHRVPVLIGHHPTDEGAFEAVNELGGISISIGDAECTAACHRLPDVDDLIQWLERVVASRPHSS